MRKLLAILFLCVSAFGQSTNVRGSTNIRGTTHIWVDSGTPVLPCGSGYTVVYQVNLQEAVGSNLTNYPYTIRGTDQSAGMQTAMKASGSGGDIQHSTTNSLGRTIPADVVVCTASSGGTPLKYEMESWDGTTAGAWTMTVGLPSLSASSTPSVYVAIGNASVTTSQEDLSLWADAHVISRKAFPNGSTLDAKDSANSSFNGTISSATATTGILDGAASFTPTANVKSSLVSSAITNLTVEFWYKFSGTPGSGVIIENGNASNQGFNLAIADTAACGTPSQVMALVFEGLGCGAYSAGGFMYPGWHQFAATRNPTSWVYTMDGLSASASTGNPNVIASSTTTTIGSLVDNSFPLTGAVDEVRQYNQPQSSNWLATNANVGYWATPGSMTVDTVTYTQPTIRQSAYCGGAGSITCKLPFPLTTGGLVVAIMAGVGSTTTDDCSNGNLSFTSSNSLTYTRQVSTASSGHLEFYSACLYTAPPAAGYETITTSNSTSVSIALYEVKHVTASGIATQGLTNLDQPNNMNVTSPGASSIVFCGTVGDHTFVSTGTTPAYTFNMGYQIDWLVSHPARAQTAYGIVGTGTINCQFNTDTNYGIGAGIGGLLAVMASAP